MQIKDFENLLAALDGLSTEQKSIIETALRGNSDLPKGHMLSCVAALCCLRLIELR